MSDSPKSNRDAFHALLIVSLLFALFLVALIIAACNTRIAFLPLTPKPAASSSSLSPRASVTRGLVGVVMNLPALSGVTAPGATAARPAFGITPGSVSPAPARAPRCGATAGRLSTA